MIIIQIIVAVILGIMAGCITGLTPGVHINLVSTLILSLSPFLLQFTSSLILSVFIVSMSILHTFLDAIPSIYLGAPESDENALSVLPGHRYLLQGKGYEALKLTVIGSLFAIILGILLCPLIIKILPLIYLTLKSYIAYLIIISSLFLIFREKKKFWALSIFLLAGIFGIISLNLNIKNQLFPLLSSLFGISGLLLSLKNKVQIPKQIITSPKVFSNQTFKAISSGTLVGTFTAIMPGLGPAQAAIIASQITKLKDSGFLILTGSLNTLNMVISFIAIFSINKARSGSVVIISRLMEIITQKDLILFLAISLITGIIATFLTLKIAKLFSSLITKINYQKLCIGIIFLIIAMTIYLSSFLGLVVLITGSFLGMLPPLLNIGRNHLMGCLILPVILFFLL